MDQEKEEPVNRLAFLPNELLVLIFSFLQNVREVAKLRYVCRRLHSACEAPSLWREFVWPHFNCFEERCVRNLFKWCGPHVKRLCFPSGHVTPSKLTVMLRHCRNLVELSTPVIKLSPRQIENAILPMENLRSLDIPILAAGAHQLLSACNKVRELTIRVMQPDDTDACKIVFTEWTKNGCKPEMLNIASTWMLSWLLRDWMHSNPVSSLDHIGCLRVYRSLEVPLNIHPPLPEFQLQFGQPCAVNLVNAGNYGLLGSQSDLLFLMDGNSGNTTLHKATMLLYSSHAMTKLRHLNCYSIKNLYHVSSVDVSNCAILSGHLEQLAIACPNLIELNLQHNFNCLKNLQGLRAVSAYCKNLQGLNLRNISVKQLESQVDFWEILATFELTYLAIELCVLVPDQLNMDIIFSLQEQLLNLQALEFGFFCNNCTKFGGHGAISVSNFPSVVHMISECYDNVIQDLVECKMIKFLNYSIACNPAFDLLSSLVNHNLEQICLRSDFTRITSTLMELVSAHGGLVHSFFYVDSVTADGIITLIENSPKLLTCQIYVQKFVDSFEKPINRGHFKTMLKARFSSRKLFVYGKYQLGKNQEYLKCDNADLSSLWSPSAYRYWHF